MCRKREQGEDYKGEKKKGGREREMQKGEAPREGEHCCAIQTRTRNNGSSRSEVSTLRYYYRLNTCKTGDTEISLLTAGVFLLSFKI